MDTIATLLGGILVALRTGLFRHAAGNPASADLLYALHNRIARLATRFERLFARFQAGTLPSQTGAKPRPSRAGQTRKPPATPRLRFPARRQWLFQFAQSPAAQAQGRLRHWMSHPDLPAFLAAAPQAGRLLRPLCRLVGVDGEPGVPDALNLPPPPPFRPSPPPPPPPPARLESIDPPPPPRRWTRWLLECQVHGLDYPGRRY